jgi:MOSC domain-containing protein YiiM
MSALGHHGTVVQVNASGGGVPKLPVFQAWISSAGLEGDWQDDRVHHGGPDRAVCLFSLDVMRRLNAEGHPIAPGTTGENLTIEGLDWALVVPGAVLTVGEAELEVTSYAMPCRTIRRSFSDENSNRISVKKHPAESRVYARVRREGVVKPGDAVRVG